MSTPLTKRLAAVMFTDMVGFSALMQQDEQTGLKKRARHRAVVEAQHARHRGEVIQYYGDGTLSIFSNSCDAVECGIAIQKALKKPLNVPVRIGIHAGNILVDHNDIIGDAVNIASRIESFGNVGGVLISDAVYEQVKNQAQWKYLSLGLFNLKNIERPFEIYAVIAPGLVVPDPDFLEGKGEKVHRANRPFPFPSTTLLGRERELCELENLLLRHRVVTVTGAGGLGKTQLAMEVCRRLQDHYKNGILFVPAADLTRASELTPLLASAFDIALNSEQGSSRGVADWIGDKSMLMVLDNLEQVVAVSGEIAKLIEVCPNLSLVCTSRSPLKIKAEQEYPLHPLALPETEDWETIAASPAVALFTARAQRADRLFELTTENAATVSAICKRLDGMPLAIELAAARIRVLPPDKLLERLHRPFDVLVSDAGDVPERHQTLHSAIEWSYSMLRTSDQVLFRRLAVFDRCFSLEDIETVCYDDPVSSFHAVNALESLLDKALVEKLDKAMRFRMLEPIRDFAREKLHESGEGTFFFQKLLHLGGNTERCPCPNIVSTVRTSDGLDVVTP